MTEPTLKGQKMSELDTRLRQVILGTDDSFPSDNPLFNFTVPTKSKSQANNALSVLTNGQPLKCPSNNATIVSRPSALFLNPNQGAPQQQHKQCWTPESTKAKIKDKSQAFCMPKLPTAWFRFREDSEFQNLVHDSPISKRRTSLVFLAGFLSGCLAVVCAMMLVIVLASSGMRYPDDLAINSYVGPATTKRPETNLNTLEPHPEHRRAPANAGIFDEKLLDRSQNKATTAPSTEHGVTLLASTTMSMHKDALGTTGSRSTTTVAAGSDTSIEANIAHHATSQTTTDSYNSSRLTQAADVDQEQTSASPDKLVTLFSATSAKTFSASSTAKSKILGRTDQTSPTESSIKKSSSPESIIFEPNPTSSKYASETTTKASTRQEKNSLTGTPVAEMHSKSTTKPSSATTMKSSWQKQSVSIISGIIYPGKKHNDDSGKASTTDEPENANLVEATSSSPVQIEQPESETSKNRRSSRNIDSSRNESDKETDGDKLGETMTTQNPRNGSKKKKSSWFTRFILAVKQTLKKINLI